MDRPQDPLNHNLRQSVHTLHILLCELIVDLAKGENTPEILESIRNVGSFLKKEWTDDHINSLFHANNKDPEATARALLPPNTPVPDVIEIVSKPFSDCQNLSRADLTLLKKLSDHSGKNGEVWLALCRGCVVVVKKILAQDRHDQARKKEFLQEATKLASLRHGNIVSLLGIYQDPSTNSVWLVEEFCSGGDLQHLLHGRSGLPKPISRARKIRMALDICRGLSWMTGENLKIIHQDIKASNIILTSSGRCKVCDFGFSVLSWDDVMPEEDAAVLGKKGSPLYCAPEILSKYCTSNHPKILRNRELTYKVDVYSFALLFWEILTQKKSPYTCRTQNELIRQVLDGVRPAFPPGTHAGLVQLISDCWAHDPDDRPDWVSIITRLEDIAIDTHLEKYPTALAFWKSKVKKEEEKLLASALAKRILNSTDDLEIAKFKRCLNAIYNNSNHKLERECKITPFKFGKLYHWFGTPKMEPIQLLEHLSAVLYQRWFFGAISKVTAEREIGNLMAGKFLIRLNGGHELTQSVEEAPFILTFLNEDLEIEHYPIQRNPHGRLFLDKEGDETILFGHSILDVVNTMQKRKLNEGDNTCQYICEGYPFSQLFVSGRVPNYIMEMETEED